MQEIDNFEVDIKSLEESKCQLVSDLVLFCNVILYALSLK